jgi:hypothetical protein
VKVAEQYIAETIRRDAKIALKAIEKVAEIARSSAGVFARKHGTEIYDAIRPDKLVKLVKNKQFIAARLPRLAVEIKESLK